ncbi:hypothetical protein [Streptomyces phaeochromogenes]|uniref:hypothetical protein n=1 Tax=Streptomyces phaeochromogenes TaxID=1923 RepID=UPI0033DFB8B3
MSSESGIRGPGLSGTGANAGGDGVMTGYPLRDRLALLAGLAGPFLVALLLVPFRTDLSRTNAALILVVAVVVAVAALGSRVAGALAALSAADGSPAAQPQSDAASSRVPTRPSTSTPPPMSRPRYFCWSSA